MTKSAEPLETDPLEADATDDDAAGPLFPAPVSDTSSASAASAPSSPDTDDLDDGTPEGGDESDASEADASDDPASTPVAIPVPPVRRARRGIDGGVHDARTPRRRRSDEPGYRDPSQHRPSRRAPRRGRAGWIAATVVLMLLLGGAVALDWYLWNTTEEWERRSEALTEMNYDLGARLSSEQQTTMQLKSEIDLLTQQLATSNQKVTALSAEKASAVDESATYLQEIEALETDVSSASGVANALHRCVDGQQELVTYLRDAENYEPEELEDFSESVRALCEEAETGNDRLQEALSR